MKYPIILSLLLIILPLWLKDLGKDNLTVFASLSYYGCDFDGDKIDDLSVWDPKTNTLYFQQTSDKKFYKKKFVETDVPYQPVFADYDGDKKTDFAFFQPDSGEWVIFLSKLPDIPFKTFLGSIGDLPIPLTLNGNGNYKPTIWRPNSSTWLITETNKEGKDEQKIILEGTYQDSACGGDFDGDGKSDLIVWRPDDGFWHIVKSSTKFDFAQSDHIQHGQEWDIIVPNDYNGDGKCDLVFWRPENQVWYVLLAGTNNKSELKFGHKDDIPLSADTDGDGVPELITWSMSKKSWNILNFKKQESFSNNWDVPEGCIPAVSILQKYE